MSLQDAMAPRLSRRSFLVSAAALAGGLSLRFDVAGEAGAEPAPHSELTAWIVISRDESVVIRVARAEMGQGSSTGLAMLVAEELACDWAKARVEFVPAHENLARRRAWGDMSTGGSRSIRASQEMLRRAGATAREMLVTAAAQRWGVPVSACRAANGIITHAPSGRTTTFGQVAAAAATIAPPERVTLKQPKDWTLIGTAQPRFDVPDKIAGTPVYAIDVRVPDMLFAAIRQCPVFTGKVKSLDAGKVRDMPGVHRVVRLPAAVAVVADSWWRAKRAVEALAVEWHSPAQARVSTEEVRRQFRAALDAGDPRVGFRRGDVAAGLRDAARHVEAEYAVPYLAHATMEPQNCTASVTADKVEVWAPTQNAEATLVAAAAAAGVPASKVLVHPVMLGGGFGRRGVVQDFVTQAVLIAKEAGRPVQLIWTREEDIRHDFYRPLVVARLAAGLDAGGLPVAWTVRLAGQSLLASIAPGPMAGTYRQFFEAFAAMPYAVPNVRVDYVLRNAPVPVGYWRGVNDTQNAFFKESFIDEMAHAAGHDPYRYRRLLLAGQPRHLAVLAAAAESARWDAPAPAGIFRGMALHAYADTVCAQVVEILLADGVRVHRVVSAIDPGHVVDPRSISAQTEGAIAFALSAALFGEITLAGGRVEQSNFHDCRVLRMSEMPEVETVIVPSGGVWGGVGELPVLPLAPALCNAVFAATGRRIRSLPLAKHDLKTIGGHKP